MKVTALALCIAISGSSAGDRVRSPTFVPAADVTVEKSFESSLEVSLVRRAIFAFTEEGETEIEADTESSETHATSTRIQWRDEYQAVEGSQVMKLRRTFVEGRRSYESKSEEREDESGKVQSRLLEHAIDFHWDAEDGEFSAQWASNGDSEHPDDSLLEGHEVLVEYQGLLPGKPVEVGDSWEVEPSQYFFLAMPGARTDIQVARSGEEFDGWVDTMEQLKEGFSGEIVCTWRSEENGKATIAIEGRVTSVTETVEVDSEDPGSRYTFRNTTSYPADGELIWDMENNRAVSFFVEGDLEDRRDAIQEEGGKPVYKWSSFYEGELREEASFE